VFSHHNLKIIPTFVFLVFLGLSACHSVSSEKENAPEVVQTAALINLSKKLESSGARVIQTGKTLRIILPSDELFANDSANFISSSPPILNTVSQLMAILETTSAQVSGYTDSQPDALRNKALSIRQADVVANYLWSKGPDARLLYSVGYGLKGQVSSERFEGALRKGANRRIEIKFRYLPVLSSL